MLPLMLNLYVSRLKEAGAPLHPRIDSELANHLGYVDRRAEGPRLLRRPSLTGADIQMSFVGEMAKVFGQAGAVSEPRGLAGADACPAGVQAEVEKGGAYRFANTRFVVPASAARRIRRGRGGHLATPSPLPPVAWAPAQGRGDGRRGLPPHHILHKYQP